MAGTDLQKFLDELRAKISIADVVGAKVKLTRKGREYTGLCPFHNEKTPSFTVNEAKGFYHCFGCGAHGDIIKFEMDANGLTFMESVEKLAHKIGLEVPRMNRESPEQTEKETPLMTLWKWLPNFLKSSLNWWAVSGRGSIWPDAGLGMKLSPSSASAMRPATTG